MKKNNDKALLLSDVRSRLQEKLWNRDDFISEVEEDHIDIMEVKDSSKLKQVTITDIPYDDTDYQFWRLHLEKHKNIKGIGSDSKTVDEILVVLKDKLLKVYLIELKSSINSPEPEQNKVGKRGGKKKKAKSHPNTLDYIALQISESISRFLVLLTIGNHEAGKYKERYKDVKIKFYGIIFYNRDNKVKDEQTKIYIKGKKKTMFTETLLRKERIAVKFFKNPNPSSDKISVKFKELP